MVRRISHRADHRIRAASARRLGEITARISPGNFRSVPSVLIVTVWLLRTASIASRSFFRRIDARILRERWRPHAIACQGEQQVLNTRRKLSVNSFLNT